MARALLAHDRQYGTRDVHRSVEAGLELTVHLLGRQLLEEACIEVGCVVHKDIDPAEVIEFRGDADRALASWIIQRKTAFER